MITNRMIKNTMIRNKLLLIAALTVSMACIMPADGMIKEKPMVQESENAASKLKSCYKELILCLAPEDLKNLAYLLQDDLLKEGHNNAILKHILFLTYVADAMASYQEDYGSKEIEQRLSGKSVDESQKALLAEIDMLINVAPTYCEDAHVANATIAELLLEFLAASALPKPLLPPTLFDYSKVPLNETHAYMMMLQMHNLTPLAQELVLAQVKKLYFMCYPSMTEDALAQKVDERKEQLDRILKKINGTQMVPRRAMQFEIEPSTPKETAMSELLMSLNEEELQRIAFMCSSGIFHPALAQGLLVKFSLLPSKKRSAKKKSVIGKNHQKLAQQLLSLFVSCKRAYDPLLATLEASLSTFLEELAQGMQKDTLVKGRNVSQERLQKVSTVINAYAQDVSLKRPADIFQNPKEKKQKKALQTRILASSLADSQGSDAGDRQEVIVKALDADGLLEKLLSIADPMNLGAEITSSLQSVPAKDKKAFVVKGILAVKEQAEQKKKFEEQELKLTESIAQETKAMKDALERKERMASVIGKVREKLGGSQVDANRIKEEADKQALQAQLASETDKVVQLNARLALLEKQKAENVDQAMMLHNKLALLEQEKAAEVEKVAQLAEQLKLLEQQKQELTKQLQEAKSRRPLFTEGTIPNFL